MWQTIINTHLEWLQWSYITSTIKRLSWKIPLKKPTLPLKMKIACIISNILEKYFQITEGE